MGGGLRASLWSFPRRRKLSDLWEELKREKESRQSLEVREVLPRPGGAVAQLTPTFQPGSAGTEDTGARSPEHHHYGHHQADTDGGTDIEGGPGGSLQTFTGDASGNARN